MRNELRKRVGAMVLEEVKSGTLDWYYISIAGDAGFYGAYLIQARGPNEAWNLLHLCFGVPEEHETLSNGPVPDAVMAKVPVELRWRLLTRDEAEKIGS